MASVSGSWYRLQLALIGSCFAALVALGAAAPSAVAKAGNLDPSFGGDGKVLDHQGSFVDMAKLDNGGILVANESTLFAYRPNGHPDAKFGDNGTVDPLSPEGATVRIEDLTVDGHGRIVVVGSANHPYPTAGYGSFAVIARYLPTGKLDGGFGGNGIFFTDLGLPPPARWSGFPSDAQVPTAPEVRALGVAVDSRERIVLSGTRAATYVGTKSLTFAPVREAFVTKLTEAGSPDPSFGGTGTTLLGGLSSIGRPAVDSQDGVYFAAGQQAALDFAEAPGQHNVVGHLDASGSVDPNFGKHGWRALTDDSFESDLDVTLDRKGRLLICRQGSKAGIERFKPNGSIDRSFGRNGIKTIVRPKGEVTVSGLAVTDSGGILVAGTLQIESISANAEPRWRLLLARLTPRGKPARRFGSRGTVVTSFGASPAEGQAVVADGIGRALVGGVVGSRLILARYLLR